jgi:hypothetical protein
MRRGDSISFAGVLGRALTPWRPTLFSSAGTLLI